MSDSPDDPDLLAAEYALGVLEPDAAAEVQQRAWTDPVLRGQIADWHRRLAPLIRLLPVASPPAALWDRIDASTGSVLPLPLPQQRAARQGVWGRIGTWRAATAVSLAIAAGLAAFAFIPRSAPVYVAALAPLSGPGASFVATSAPNGALLVTPIANVTVPAGHDLELWALPAGAKRPLPLGVLPATGRQVTLPDVPRDQTQILVSLEPTGGSPTGLPTGPVLWGGKLVSGR